MKFIKLKEGLYVQEAHIITIKQTSGSTGKDGAIRTWIVIISKEAAGSSEDRHQSVWLTDEEAAPLLKILGPPKQEGL